MQKKKNQRKFMIWGIAFIIAIMIVSILNGKNQKDPIIIVKAEIDASKSLDKQTEKFEIIRISKGESVRMGDSVVRNIEQLNGKRLPAKLKVGSPIPVDILLDGQGVGEFAAKTAQYYTVYRFSGAVSQLPPAKQIGVGDKIDIALMQQFDKFNSEIKPFMKGIEISDITETDVFIKVSQKDYYRLVLGQQLGQYIIQLPGQKAVDKCKADDKEKLKGKNCYSSDDLPSQVTTDDIKQDLNKNQTYGTGYTLEEVKKYNAQNPEEAKAEKVFDQNKNTPVAQPNATPADASATPTDTKTKN